MRVLKSTPKIDFMKMHKVAFIFTAFLVVGSLILMATKGLNYGIDFAGGVELQVMFQDPTVGSAQVREAMEKAGFHDASVVQLAGGTEKKNEYLISLLGSFEDANQMSDKVKVGLAQGLGEKSFEIRRIDSVGPKAGSDLKRSAVLSMVYCFIAILVYIWFRFDMKYAPGAILCLVHDAVVTAGIFILLGKEFSLTILAALLTIIGYSLNDTIVTYDRMREIIHKSGLSDWTTVINRAINETLGRTILTSTTVLFTLMALYWKTGGIVQDFALAMLIGVVLGAYSTIFVASPIIIYTEKLMNRIKS